MNSAATSIARVSLSFGFMSLRSYQLPSATGPAIAYGPHLFFCDSMPPGNAAI